MSSVLTDMSLALSAALCVADEMSSSSNRLRDMILADHELYRRVETVALSQTSGLFGDPRTVVACKALIRDVKQEHPIESSKSCSMKTAVVVLNSPRVSNMNKYESFTVSAKESDEDDTIDGLKAEIALIEKRMADSLSKRMITDGRDGSAKIARKDMFASLSASMNIEGVEALLGSLQQISKNISHSSTVEESPSVDVARIENIKIDTQRVRRVPLRHQDMHRTFWDVYKESLRKIFEASCSDGNTMTMDVFVEMCKNLYFRDMPSEPSSYVEYFRCHALSNKLHFEAWTNTIVSIVERMRDEGHDVNLRTWVFYICRRLTNIVDNETPPLENVRAASSSLLSTFRTDLSSNNFEDFGFFSLHSPKIETMCPPPPPTSPPPPSQQSYDRGEDVEVKRKKQKNINNSNKMIKRAIAKTRLASLNKRRLIAATSPIKPSGSMSSPRSDTLDSGDEKGYSW